MAGIQAGFSHLSLSLGCLHPHMLHHRLLHGLEMHPFLFPHRRPCDSTPVRKALFSLLSGNNPRDPLPQLPGSHLEGNDLSSLPQGSLPLAVPRANQHLPLGPAEEPGCRRMGAAVAGEHP